MDTNVPWSRSTEDLGGIVAARREQAEQRKE
jgi:hypothetical protein